MSTGARYTAEIRALGPEAELVDDIMQRRLADMIDINGEDFQPLSMNTHAALETISRRIRDGWTRDDVEAAQRRGELVCAARSPEEPKWTCVRPHGHGGRHESADGGDWHV